METTDQHTGRAGPTGARTSRPPGNARPRSAGPGRPRSLRFEQALAVCVGRNIVWWREQRRLSQAGLAKAVGRERTTVGRWESGDRLPSLPALLALGEALGCGPGALLAGAPVARRRDGDGKEG